MCTRCEKWPPEYGKAIVECSLILFFNSDFSTKYNLIILSNTYIIYKEKIYTHIKGIFLNMWVLIETVAGVAGLA